jgi:hypothetical protein
MRGSQLKLVFVWFSRKKSPSQAWSLYANSYIGPQLCVLQNNCLVSTLNTVESSDDSKSNVSETKHAMFKKRFAKHLIMAKCNYRQWSRVTWRHFPREPDELELESASLHIQFYSIYTVYCTLNVIELKTLCYPFTASYTACPTRSCLRLLPFLLNHTIHILRVHLYVPIF